MKLTTSTIEKDNKYKFPFVFYKPFFFDIKYPNVVDQAMREINPSANDHQVVLSRTVVHTHSHSHLGR